MAKELHRLKACLILSLVAALLLFPIAGHEDVKAGRLGARYDVIVAGTDPEGVAAAVSAARNGLRVLLIDGRNREKVGGLITLGWLNSLDLSFSPVKSAANSKLNVLNKGIFLEWYRKLEGSSMDIRTAERSLQQLIDNEPNISLFLKLRMMKPIMSKDGTAVDGISFVNEAGERKEVFADAVIDATQDGDIAALAKAPYTTGREDLGESEARMAVTLVFRMSGVTDRIWQSFGRREDTGSDARSAWGFKSAKNYESSNPQRLALRGLNIGRQNDDTILINAMHIFGIDPLNPASLTEGMKLGREEAPRIAAYLKRTFKEFSSLNYAGVAPELYVRESRHMKGEYRLTMADVMRNRDFWDAIAYGSYDVDIQRLSPHDYGAIMLSPKQYGIPFRALVPLEIDHLLVVGRAASFDSLPHGSARTIPIGMATAQAAGAAVRLAKDKGVTVRELSRSHLWMAELRGLLEKQGMDLKMNRLAKEDYEQHWTYNGLVAAVSMCMTIGGYHNSMWDLDGKLTAAKQYTMTERLTAMHSHYFQGNPAEALGSWKQSKKALTIEQAADAILLAVDGTGYSGSAYEELKRRGWIKDARLLRLNGSKPSTNGEAYMIIGEVMRHYAGIDYK